MSIYKPTGRWNLLPAVLLMLLSAGCGKGRQKVPSAPVDTVPAMVMQIQKCSKLYTAECRMHKIVTHSDTLSLRGQFMKRPYRIAVPLGERTVAIPMDAVVKGYIDFSGFTAANIEREGRKIHVILPDPQLQLVSTTICHDEMKQYVALMRRRFSDEELTRYERQGREAVIAAIPQTGIVDMARDNIARILIPMFVRMGFAEDDVTVSFRKDFNPNHIGQLLERTEAGK